MQEDTTRENVLQRFNLPNPVTEEGSFALKHEYEGMPLVCSLSRHCWMNPYE